MSAHTVEVSKAVQFTFTDSGPPSTERYTTFILVHGHTYHSGVFKKLGALAKDNSVRIICLNRREYEGSTSHTPEELRVYQAGNDEERTKLISEEGVNLALCVDAIILKCALPASGDVALVGWSLGNTFTLAAMASIASLPHDIRNRLAQCIKTFVLWDPPSQALGIEDPQNPYVPLYDMTIPDDVRGQAFGVWVASYFTHSDLIVHDPKHLQRKPNAKPSNPPTFHDLPFEDLLAITDFSVGVKCDTILTEPTFKEVVKKIIDTALFDPKTREAWGHPKVAHMWGEANPWNVPWAVWNIEERVQDAQGKAPIAFHRITGANHFLMYMESKSTTLISELADGMMNDGRAYQSSGPRVVAEMMWKCWLNACRTRCHP
ncbi:AB hydrolase-1 domain-containing protein [Mycena sanguinolenta]|uniref:AB hydrolase-1 domain-containing protein n=1 Tax=Mycena sanguinolenta TaxID=230812 RepID=A0A8H6Y9V5_9AGAR|nr:AB hydrolase-1 domain-containing protein [Mycena sanguinolenta]